VTQIPILTFERRERDRVVAGVCGGVADALGVDPTLVRLVFALLALAGGAGILLYFALWVWTSGRRPVFAVLILAAATMALLQSLGVPTAVVIGAGLMVGGLVLLARRGATLRPGGSRLFIPGIALAMGGAVLMLEHLGSSEHFVGPGALAGALALILGPWLWQLAAHAGAEQLVVVDQNDTDHASPPLGIVSSTSVPFPGDEVIVADPPARRSRDSIESAIPRRSAATEARSKPTPRSRTKTETEVGSTSA
jgi:phage shock protein PspC (stress-responsive transcriptional regulator)